MMQRAMHLFAAVMLVCALVRPVDAQETPSPPPAPPVLPTATPSELPSPGPNPSPTATPSAALAVTPQALNLHPSQTATLVIGNANGVISTNADAPLAQFVVDQNARTVS